MGGLNIWYPFRGSLLYIERGSERLGGEFCGPISRGGFFFPPFARGFQVFLGIKPFLRASRGVFKEGARIGIFSSKKLVGEKYTSPGGGEIGKSFNKARLFFRPVERGPF